MKKEKNFSETDFQKKALESLSDDEILQGFKDADARIVREYYYGYCRVAYCIYDKRYDLQHKPGMDFYSLAHEYYLYLCEHDFKPLEDRKPSMSLKTWMVNGFRFLLLDKLKEVVKEHHFESYLFYLSAAIAQAFARCRFVITTCVWASANVDTIACSASKEH